MALSLVAHNKHNRPNELFCNKTVCLCFQSCKQRHKELLVVLKTYFNFTILNFIYLILIDYFLFSNITYLIYFFTLK